MGTALSYITMRNAEAAANPAVSEYITEAEGQVSDTAYGSNRYKAVALLVLHQLALEKRNSESGGSSPSGQISSEKAGDVARSYSGGFFLGTVQSGIDPYLAQTSYGTELAALQSACIPLFYSRPMGIV
jgi:hypothetical protein